MSWSIIQVDPHGNEAPVWEDIMEDGLADWSLYYIRKMNRRREGYTFRVEYTGIILDENLPRLRSPST